MPTLDESEREALVEMCRAYPDREIILPESAYSSTGKQWVVRTEIDGIRWVLHRWLYDQTHERPLGTDYLRRRRGVGARNVNPFLFERVSRTAAKGRDFCPNGHRYAEVGEVFGLKDTRCAKCHENRLARRRVGGLSKAEINRRKTHCDHGHEFTPENTLYRPSDNGARRCATCEHGRAVRRAAQRQPRERELR